jgi:membrane protein DedA with SNARE-associated domain
LVDRFLSWLAGLPTAPTYLVLMALSATENVFPPVPADVAVVLGAFLSRMGETSAVLVGVLCWMANTASSSAMFFYARSKGRAFFETGWPRRLMPPRAVQALEGAYARHGVFGIFLSRFLPGVRAGVTPFAGLLGMPPLKALIPAATASALWYAFLVVAGTALGLSWESAKHLVEDANRILGFVSAAAVVALLIWLWRRSRAA